MVCAGIAVKNVDKFYGQHTVLKNVSFAVDAGASLVIQGPSGCGKSTLLRILAGLEAPDAGEIIIDGRTVAGPGRNDPPWNRGIGFVFQAPTLWPHMTIAENIMYPIMDWPKAKRRDRMMELLGRLGIEEKEDSFPDEISGGQARRVALARAFAARPRILMLDEPLTNLNRDLKLLMLDYLKKETALNGSTLIFVTHDREEAEYISPNILSLSSINECSGIEL